jgi:uracil-DNA glycosylase family 4
MSGFRSLDGLSAAVVKCRECPRLVAWREEAARRKVRRFADMPYWGRPLPGFGDPEAGVVLVGLAPAAHGGNRTGRMFTGDESGNWLVRALYAAGMANQDISVDRNDGLELNDCYITAAVRCAPPDNKPLPAEFHNCRSYLLNELRLLKNMRVVVGLGKIGFDAAASALSELGLIEVRKKPAFGHAVIHRTGSVVLMGTYHPSQQNTFTKRLTRPMLEDVMVKAKGFAEKDR